MNATVCAIVVSYNPTAALLDNVAALAGQVDQIIVVDNGSTSNLELLQRLAVYPGCRLMRNGENLGIAAALNIGVQQAVADGYSWIATFDQDSLVGDGYVARLLSAWERCPFREQVMLVAPRYRDAQTGAISSYAQEQAGAAEEFAEITHTMTSGNLLRSVVFARVGLFDAAFFIDCVDHEFCLRLRRHGYRLIEVASVVLQHGLGRMTLHPLFGKNRKVYNHAPLRRYYNARNRLVVYKRYLWFFPRWVLRDLGNYCREIAGIILFEGQKAAKLAAIGKGLLHGLIGKMGKAA